MPLAIEEVQTGTCCTTVSAIQSSGCLSFSASTCPFLFFPFPFRFFPFLFFPFFPFLFFPFPCLTESFSPHLIHVPAPQCCWSGVCCCARPTTGCWCWRGRV